MRNVVILKHPDPQYRGFLGGVDFYNGQGSTTDTEAVRVLLTFGCVASEPEKPASVAAVSPAPEIGTGKTGPEAERPRVYANRKDREHDDRTRSKLRGGK